MKSEKLELVPGSGDVFRDLGHKNADAEQFKAILAAEITKALDREHLTMRAAHSHTGIAAADFSRIRNADLGRFTVDRLMSIINRLGSRVEVKVRLHRAETFAREMRGVKGRGLVLPGASTQVGKMPVAEKRNSAGGRKRNPQLGRK
jgi:predicted XRE-type DNA-binding protein